MNSETLNQVMGLTSRMVGGSEGSRVPRGGEMSDLGFYQEFGHQAVRHMGSVNEDDDRSFDVTEGEAGFPEVRLSFTGGTCGFDIVCHFEELELRDVSGFECCMDDEWKHVPASIPVDILRSIFATYDELKAAHDEL